MIFDHFFSGLTGNAFSRKLGRDLWRSEDLWSATPPVKNRWLKLVWVYLLCTLYQLVLPAACLGLIYGLIKGGIFERVLLAAGFATVCGVVITLASSTFECFVMSREAQKSKATGEKSGT
jgi:hypothetical protein